MHSLKNNPKIQFICLLFLFYVVTLFHLPLNLALQLLVLCVGFTVLADLLFTFLRRKTFFIPYSAVITGLILTLIIDPSASWFQILVISVAAMAIKNFIRISRRHIFNPVASGLAGGWVIFKLNPSWWGASLYTPGAITLPNTIVFLSLLALAFVSCYRYKRYNSVISFLISSAFLSILFSLSAFSVISILSTFAPGNLFYAVVMVAEPMTSPINRKRQILYGFTVALIFVLLVVFQKNISHLGFSNVDSSLIALLIGNLLFFNYR